MTAVSFWRRSQLLILFVILLSGFYQTRGYAFVEGQIVTSKALRPDKNGDILVNCKPALSRTDDLVEIELTVHFKDTEKISGPPLSDLEIKLDDKHIARIEVLAITDKGKSFRTEISSWDDITKRVWFQMTDRLPKESRVTKIVIKSKDIKRVDKIVWYSSFNK